jgi:hypothetical protein
MPRRAIPVPAPAMTNQSCTIFAESRRGTDWEANIHLLIASELITLFLVQPVVHICIHDENKTQIWSLGSGGVRNTDADGSASWQCSLAACYF